MASLNKKLLHAKHSKHAIRLRALRQKELETRQKIEAASAAVDAQVASSDNASEAIRDGSVNKSTAIISICVVISRITGFFRTWIMAFAFGATALASAYQVANNLPSMLYELVAGGILVTAFLPVYVTVKKRLGQEASNKYASNLFTIVVLFLAIISVLCALFPQVVIYTQSFWSDQEQMGAAVFFFQFFAIQLLFYGAGAIISGLLNANRDYLWASLAPAANNIIVIGAFIAYALTVSGDPVLAMYFVALGNPLGVFMQLVLQAPALRKNGIKLRPRIDFKDPGLKDTLSLGIPALFVMICSFIVVSVQTAAAYSFADNGPSVLAYARLWFTLPYAFLAVPITTSMFTELAEMQAEGNMDGVKHGIIACSKQIVFFMFPMTVFLVVFAAPLITLYLAGEFSADAIEIISSYLMVLATALPFYGVNTYLQKIFSSLRKMKAFAGINAIAGGVQVILTVLASVFAGFGIVGINAIAWAEIIFYILADVLLFAYLNKLLGHLGVVSVVKSAFRGILLGGAGSLVSWSILQVLTFVNVPYTSSIVWALVAIIVAGVPGLLVTFGAALRAKFVEAAFLERIIRRLKNKLKRK